MGTDFCFFILLQKKDMGVDAKERPNGEGEEAGGQSRNAAKKLAKEAAKAAKVMTA